MEDNWRGRFPIFQRHPELVYLDSAATAQRLDTVIDTMHEFSLSGNANVHRGIYNLSNKATDQYEQVREKVARFIKAKSPENIGFTKGTTESINVVARGYLEPRLNAGDNVVVSILEHHANFLPWQEVCKARGAELRILPMNENGRLSAETLESLIDNQTKLVAINHISNTLGRINPVEELAVTCRQHGIPILIDAAQSAGLHALDVEQSGFDFVAFSGHKLFGPMGTGVLYVSDQYRQEVQPLLVGGGMIKYVDIKGSSYREFPYNLEAGTPNVPGVLGLGAAVDFLMEIDRDAAVKHVKALAERLVSGVATISEVELLPYYDLESGIVSFNVKDIHPHDVAGYLNRDQIAVRAGMHCTQPLLDHLDLTATVRASFSIYNEASEVDRLIESLKNLIAFWK